MSSARQRNISLGSCAMDQRLGEQPSGAVPQVAASIGSLAAAAPTASTSGPWRLLRRILVSEYFVLYLTIAYFAAVAVFFPALVEPRNIANQLSNVWPLLAVAI